MRKEVSMTTHQFIELPANCKNEVIDNLSQQWICNDGNVTESNSGRDVGLGYSKPAKITTSRNEKLISGDGKSISKSQWSWHPHSAAIATNAKYQIINWQQSCNSDRQWQTVSNNSPVHQSIWNLIIFINQIRLLFQQIWLFPSLNNRRLFRS